MRRPAPTLPVLAALVVAALAASGCRSGTADDGRARVLASTTQVGDLVRAVGGDRVDVDQILRPNSDPHEYEPRPSDAEAAARATVVFRSGGDVDGWLSGVTGQAGGDATTVTLIDAVERRGDDPHWWQDPRNGERAVDAIRAALTRADPAGARGYRRRAAAYTARLRTLDRDIAACVGRLPAGRRKLVTSHDALGYYARRYGFRVIGTAIPSLSTQAQPSAASTARLVSLIEREHVAAIFPESSVSRKLEQAIADDAGASVGRPLWADALGPAGSDGATYIASLAANTRAIVSGLTRGAVSCARLGPERLP